MISAGPAPSMRWAQIRTSARIAFLAGSIGVLTVAVVTGVHMRRALALVALAAAISAIRRAYVQWTRVIQGLLAIILFSRTGSSWLFSYSGGLPGCWSNPARACAEVASKAP
jgi:hypothetical protein